MKEQLITLVEFNPPIQSRNTMLFAISEDTKTGEMVLHYHGDSLILQSYDTKSTK